MEESSSAINLDRMDINNRLKGAISVGIDFLYEHQYPNGEFCTYLSPDEQMLEWCYPDSNVFCTSVIAGCLVKVDQTEQTRNILESAGRFLYYQMIRGGLWNFFSKFNVNFKAAPADADTTSYTSALLHELGYVLPENKLLLYENVNNAGLFYTWVVLRRSSKLSISKLLVVGRELKRPVHTLFFWLKHEVKRRDVDAVVNANVLFYLGLNEKTTNVVSYLITLIKEAKEENSDKWYKNPIVFYYFVSRNYAKIREFDVVKPLIIERLFAKINRIGNFGKSDLENALAISALLNFEHQAPEIDSAILSLLNAQNKRGYWKRSILFYTGPSKAAGWGSEETTTAFCLEALSMYKNQLKSNG